MARKWGSFVILADMRTGSNALEEKLNAFHGLTCHGELFNPHFIGDPKRKTLFDIDLKRREERPESLLDAMRSKTDGLAGFRLFSDHDPRALDLCLSDRSCAKIALTRNPLESYISLKIAKKTGQWWLGDFSSAKPGTTRFDVAEFAAYRDARAEYLGLIRRRLQKSGQTAFWIDSEDLDDPEIISGLARFLGANEEEAAIRTGRRQNPVPMSEKVENFDEMRAALAAEDPFGVDHLPDHEPARGPNVPSFLACRSRPLLYMPVKCASDRAIRQWMADLDESSVDDLEQGFTQKTLRRWKRQNRDHRSFTVVMHPLERAHEAFCRFILPVEEGAFTGIRETLRRSYGVPLPDDGNDPAYRRKAHHSAFLAFLSFLKGNLAGQTSIRVDAAWASQLAALQGISVFCIPDLVLRSERLENDLRALLVPSGTTSPDLPVISAGRFSLADIYSEALERAARSAYQRDYLMFGYGPWQRGQAA